MLTMAMALPNHSDMTQSRRYNEEDHELYREDNSEDSDADDDIVGNHSVDLPTHNSSGLSNSPSKSHNHSSYQGKTAHEPDVADGPVQNGSAPTADRYGFIGGSQFTDPEQERRIPIEILRKRELKWLDMFQNWEKWMSKRFKKVKERCRKGIPPSLRSRAWQYLCGSNFLMDQHKGKFDEYLSHPGDPKWIDDITKDLHRQFPLHEMFSSRNGYGQEDLFRLLKAYTVYNPIDGYCQAQAPLAAILLMHMPAEEAFWCFVSICEKYLPGYYSVGLEAVYVDGEVLFGLVKKTMPSIYKHLKKNKIEPILYMTEWFMCVFIRTLPWSCVLRVWDMFLCEGVKVVLRIGLVLVRLCLGSPEKLSASQGMYETLQSLRHIPEVDESFIVRESLRINITEREMEKEHQKQAQRRRSAKEKANKPDSGKSRKKQK